MSNPPHDLGVVVGRFQVAELHRGHLHLIDVARAGSRRLLILVGSAREAHTLRNPLPYEVRRDMLLQLVLPHEVAPLEDVSGSDEEWSRQLDNSVAHFGGHRRTAALFHGRDSFAKHYRGRHRLVEVPELPELSGTAARRAIEPPRDHASAAAFRAGAIWATMRCRAQI